MKYYILDNDQFLEFDVRPDGNRLQIRHRKKIYMVDLVKLDAHRFSFIVNNRSYHVELYPNENNFHLVLNQKRFQVAVLDSRQKIQAEMFDQGRRQSTAATVKAPMPGLILRIEVKEGQFVRAGNPLLVMEAMKMENEIRAEGNGIIKEILVKEQQTVDKDTILIKLGNE